MPSLQELTTEWTTTKRASFMSRLDALTADTPIATYTTLLSDINTYLNQVNTNEIDTILKENETLKKSISIYIQQLYEVKELVETAISRDKSLRSKNTDVSSHALFLLDRPIRRYMIPYLWVFSILFIGVALYIFKSSFPAIQYDFQTIFGMIYLFFSDRIVINVLLVVAIITIVFLSLKVAGVFGK